MPLYQHELQNDLYINMRFIKGQQLLFQEFPKHTRMKKACLKAGLWQQAGAISSDR